MPSKPVLLSLDEYQKINHPVPYTYIVSNGAQHLYYFGARHSDNPENHQFKTLEKFWEEFLKSSKKEKIVLVEGGLPSREALVSKEKEDVIKQGGEASFIAWLAYKKGINVSSPELPENKWFEEMSKFFPKEIIAYYDFARICYQWHRKQNKSAFDEYVSPFLSMNAKNSRWEDFNFSLEHMMLIHEKLFKIPFDKNNAEFFKSIIDTTKNISPINEISRFEDSGLRDSFIVSQIETHWRDGKDIFIVYGAPHAVIQEEYLKSSLG